MVTNGLAVDRHAVNSIFKKIRPLKALKPHECGWTMAVLNQIQKSGWEEFTTKQAYCFEQTLQKPKTISRQLEYTS